MRLFSQCDTPWELDGLLIDVIHYLVGEDLLLSSGIIQLRQGFGPVQMRQDAV